jgi:transcriptional regulator with XRE-family HTH domain
MNTATIDVRLGKQIKALRERQNVPMSQLSAALNVSLVDFLDYEAGRRRISASDLFLLTRVLGVEVNDIFTVLHDVVPIAVMSAPVCDQSKADR